MASRLGALRMAVAGRGWTLPLAAWAGMMACGFIQMSRYATTACDRGESRPNWPHDAALARDPGRANLVMFVHPRCPCSRASIAGLHEIMERHRDLVSAHILFLKPADCSESWSATDLWESAAAIPGAQLVRDDEGLEARRFGAATSGHVMLFEKSGQLAFSGGITASRGHRGESAGRQAIVDLLMQRPAPESTPVFGCSLFESSCACRIGNER